MMDLPEILQRFLRECVLDAGARKASTLVVAGFAGRSAAEVAEQFHNWHEALEDLRHEMIAIAARLDKIAAAEPSAEGCAEYRRLRARAQRLKSRYEASIIGIQVAPEWVRDYLAIQNACVSDDEREKALRRLAEALGTAGFGVRGLNALFDIIVRAEAHKKRREGTIVGDQSEPVGAPPARERGIGSEDFRRWLRNRTRGELRATEAVEDEIATDRVEELLDKAHHPRRRVGRGIDRAREGSINDPETGDRRRVLPGAGLGQPDPDELASALEAVSGLPDDERALLTAIVCDGQSVDEIVATKRMSRRTVYRKIDAIVRRLKP